MKRVLRGLDPWAPPVVLMAITWFLSSQSSLDSGLGLADLIGRKLVHATGYGVLCLLWWRALRTRLSMAGAIGAALAITVAYGAVDEYHQTFTPGRVGSPIDVAIDATGATVAALLIRRRAPGRRASAIGPTASRAR